MPTKLDMALKSLNEAHASMGRVYEIRQEGDKFALSMPLGGEYPATDCQATMERLSRMTQAAKGGS